jgi:intracellular sulfur oxidation DsrE/DsrF family protein
MLHHFRPRGMGALALILALTGCALPESGPAAKDGAGRNKVVYHISDTAQQVHLAMQYIRNQLEVDPKAKIVVVAHANGVDFMMDGAKDKNGNPYNIPVEELNMNGVRFEVCEITLRERNLRKSQFIPEATFVSSGVAEITRLQQREGYAYLRP